MRRSEFRLATICRYSWRLAACPGGLGDGAVWSHATAGYQLGLIKSAPPLIHLTVPLARRVRAQPGLWGKQLRLIAQDALKGSDSLLEVNYVRNVERRHAAPRQHPPALV
ncbi:MAG: hypothetical protein WKF82_10260 [Nocardioidaceae bacterium]